MKASVKREVQDIIDRYSLSCTVEGFRSFVPYSSKISWNGISQHEKLSEGFIREFKNEVRWFWISKCQKLSEAFILEHRHLVEWHEICQHQKLSMTFISKHSGYVNWGLIGEYQKLSESFMRRFKNRLDGFTIFITQKLSVSFIKDMKVMFELREQYLKAKRYQELSFKEKSDAQKLKEVKAYAKKWDLEFDGEYLYAFREHDRFGRGAFNKAIFYDKIGKEYRDWHCDMDETDGASFGLGIWPRRHNTNTKVKVHYKDWGCEVNGDDNGKGRVMAFTLLGEDRG